MKKLIAISFLLVYLFGATEGKQLLRLPLLLEHFSKHKQVSPKVTIGSFIKMHYIDAPVVDDDYQQDMQLPFKTFDVHYATSPVIMPSLLWWLPQQITKMPYPEYAIFNDDIPTYLMLYTIFQPPKMLA